MANSGGTGEESQEGSEAYERGTQLQSEKDLVGAEQQLRLAAGIGHRAAALALAGILMGRGDPDEAEKWYQNALDARSSRAMLGLGAICMDRGDNSQAKAWSSRWQTKVTPTDSKHSESCLRAKVNTTAPKCSSTSSEAWSQR